ncbi:hypothetical protein S83_060796 [Arachis hypogaea]|nr:uncharacterized protein LOC114925677 [Arachis hypogaea]QHN94267.1 uncharacterized protein DS421_17g599750 [Arachis hypogaea]
MGSLKEKSSSLSLNCGSDVGGGSSLLRKKKKFEYNNDKCLHGIEAVVLNSGTEWNPDRLFLRCPLWESAEHRCEYFVWLDEVEEKTRNVGTDVVSEERPLKQTYQKMNELTECATKVEEVMGICLGLGFWTLLILMIYAQK